MLIDENRRVAVRASASAAGLSSVTRGGRAAPIRIETGWRGPDAGSAAVVSMRRDISAMSPSTAARLGPYGSSVT